MSKKILLLSSVIFLSSCGANSISELGDKFLDLINPSDAATEQADLGGDAMLVAIDENGGFTIDELEQLSNDELIAIAKEKGLGDLIVLDADGNLQNRDQIINAIVESGDLLDGKTAELESLSDDALIEMINSKGMDDLVVLDADGNLANRDELIQALMDDAAAMLAIIENFKNSSDSFILYFDYDDTEIDEVSTRKIIEHANFMQDNPSLSLRLEGHADERGTREYNLALGENRALSVKEVLSLYNLDDRILVVSYGEESPVMVGSNELAWEENRRVEFSYY
ncbi:OmpA family protein [Candidatus Thioglobus sp.]|nr:OmpA family protein [Candidatus Thioglobus sp.]MDB4026718.1 OmpA family protein [Candidatus Thioglobus sp.]MDC1450011.1 OmpA family protein [Candidatus Thioglobus sp.]